MKKENLSVLGAGFACLDIIRTQNREMTMLGGTAANVLTILSLLGLKAEFLIARYSGQSGKFLEEAFKKRGVKSVFFADTKNQAPRIIEGMEQGKHFFATTCPKCGRNLVKCKLPSAGQIDRIRNHYDQTPDIFFFDRISEGIKECAIRNKNGWNIYEPNSCRMYSNLIHGIGFADIVKYSEDRIPEKITSGIIRDIRDTNVVLLIVTMGEAGVKYIYRTGEEEFSDWNYIPATPIDNVIDSSGSGDWLTAIFLFLLIKKYPEYTIYLDERFLRQSLSEAQEYAARNCSFIGAQGMLRDRSAMEIVNSELNGNAPVICDLTVNWKCDCDCCYNEN